MRLVRPATELVELYDVELPAERWLESIRSVAARCFDGWIGVQAYMFQTGAEGSFRPGEIASEPEMTAVSATSRWHWATIRAGLGAPWY